MKELFEEIFEEATDFFEDLWEHIAHKPPHHPEREKKIVKNGVMLTVRPAYAFAERVDNLLKLVFGLSIIVSAVTATYLGFASVTDLLKVLIDSIIGRLLLGVIGSSYAILALWKLLHIEKA